MDFLGRRTLFPFLSRGFFFDVEIGDPVGFGAGELFASAALFGGDELRQFVRERLRDELEIFWLLPREEWDRKPATRELNLAEKVKERTAAAV